MDALSDVLRVVRLTGAIFFDVCASDPWVAETPEASAIVGRIFPDADHLISFHVVTRGACWGGVAGEPLVALDAGDVLVFAHGDPHLLASAPDMRGRPDLERYRRPSDGELPFTITMGPAPGETGIVCGFLGCDARPFNPLLAALPRVLRVRHASDGSIAALVDVAIAESKARRPGGAAVLGRLSELMFVDAVRRYIEMLPANRTDWLAGLRDPFIGRALAALHGAPERAWTLATLARDVGLSRSVLAERFGTFVGQPPMQYLTNWRMQLAATALLHGTEGLAAIAERIGYESESSFSRAFKKVVGVAPGAWRAARRTHPPVPAGPSAAP